MTRSGSTPTGLALLVIPLVALCLAGCGVLGAWQWWWRQARLPYGYATMLCVGANLRGPTQVGLAWRPPSVSTLKPGLLQNPACVVMPWLPALAQRGGFLLPP
jgi:hypothetical protein